MKTSKGFAVLGLIIGVIIGLAAVVGLYWSKGMEEPKRELMATETVTVLPVDEMVEIHTNLVAEPQSDGSSAEEVYAERTVLIFGDQFVPVQRPRSRFSKEQIEKILGIVGSAARNEL